MMLSLISQKVPFWGTWLVRRGTNMVSDSLTNATRVARWTFSVSEPTYFYVLYAYFFRSNCGAARWLYRDDFVNAGRRWRLLDR